MPRPEAVQRVFATLEVRDPDKTTICIGSAALAVHFAVAGSPIASPGHVSVLCSSHFFNQQTANSNAFEGVSRFQIQWPDENDQYILSPVLEIEPNQNHPNLLPFSASRAMGGIWLPTYYDSCMQQPEELAEYEGYKFLRAAVLLTWMAVTGRRTDLQALERLMPRARTAGLLKGSAWKVIEDEYVRSSRLRRLYPDRIFARSTSGNTHIAYPS